MGSIPTGWIYKWFEVAFGSTQPSPQMRLFLVCKLAVVEHTASLYPDTKHPDALAVLRKHDASSPECAPHFWIWADTSDAAIKQFPTPTTTLEDVLLK